MIHKSVVTVGLRAPPPPQEISFCRLNINTMYTLCYNLLNENNTEVTPVINYYIVMCLTVNLMWALSHPVVTDKCNYCDKVDNEICGLSAENKGEKTIRQLQAEIDEHLTQA